MHFFYDAQSRPSMVEFDGTLYTYVHNLQGDIIGIVDNAGSKVVEYGYDAWGKPVLTWSAGEAARKRSLKTAYKMLLEMNPFRYRGYVWDEETGLYYLRSRYYSMALGRFINLDNLLGKVKDVLQTNLFCYCAHNPVMHIDPSGHLFTMHADCGVSSKIKVRRATVYYNGKVYKLMSQYRLPLVPIKPGSMPSADEIVVPPKKIIASGNAKITITYPGAIKEALGTYALDSYPFINVFKDRYGYAEVNVTIMQWGDEEAFATINVQLVKNITDMSMDDALWKNSTVKSGWIRLEELTTIGGEFFSYSTKQKHTLFMMKIAG